MSFSTTAVGVPHLVEVSYFPNWTISGGDGVYRVAPSLMLVVPEQENVTLRFSVTWVEQLGTAITVITVIGIIGYVVVGRRRRKRAERNVLDDTREQGISVADPQGVE